MKGGVILKRGGTLVDGVLHMIVHGTLSLVTNESSFGVIFSITCANTPFMGMDHEDVKTICLKLCLLNERPTDKTIGENEKTSVSLDEFNHEVKLQQDIFLAVSTTSDEKVCPGIIQAIIDEQIPTPSQHSYIQLLLHHLGIQSIVTNKTLLKELSTMQGEPFALEIVQELIKTQLPIGIIAMEMIPDSLPLKKNPSRKYIRCISAIAKLVRIFFRTDERGVVGTVHCDCHLGNVLTIEDSAIIIDFGSTVDRYTSFTAAQNKTFEETWGEPLDTVYDRCCSFNEILFEPKIRGQDHGVEQLEELLNFFIFMDSLKNQKYGRDRVQLNGLLEQFVEKNSVDVFEMQVFKDSSLPDILAECRRSRKIDHPHSGAELRRLQEEGRLFTGKPSESLHGKPLSEELPNPKRQRDRSLAPMTGDDKRALYSKLTKEDGLTHEQAHEIVELSSQDIHRSIHDLIRKVLQGGNNKRIKNVSKYSTASHHHATRRHSSQRKKSGTLRRVQR